MTLKTGVMMLRIQLCQIRYKGRLPELILPIRRIRKLRRVPETPGGPLALKDVLILVLFLSLASGYENMNDPFF